MNYRIGKVKGDLKTGQRFLLALVENEAVYYSYNVEGKLPTYIDIADTFKLDFERQIIGGGICRYGIVRKYLEFCPEFETRAGGIDRGVVKEVIDKMRELLLSEYRRIDPSLKYIEVFDNPNL
jgi:hypothetical protein